VTDSGPLLLEVDGSAPGLSNSFLIMALGKGMARADRGRVAPFEQIIAAPVGSLLLHVEQQTRPPRAQLTLRLFSAGRLIRTVSSGAPPVTAFPDMVFLDSIAGLGQRLLPLDDRRKGTLPADP